jgi:hypothetical protein
VTIKPEWVSEEGRNEQSDSICGRCQGNDVAVSIESVADILDRELQALIEEWITRPDTSIPSK